MGNIYFANIESEKLESLEELRAFYEEEIRGREDYHTFSEWLDACMVSNNGALENVEKVGKNYFENLLNDGLINHETCDFWTSLNTEIYKTKDNYFYSLDGHYAYGIEDLKVDLPMLDDYCRKNKIKWKFASRDGFVIVGGRFLPYLMTLSNLYDDCECMKVEIDGKYYFFG